MLSEDRKIKTRAQLREYLEADCARYPMSARRIRSAGVRLAMRSASAAGMLALTRFLTPPSR